MQRPGTLIKSNGSRQSPEYLNKASTVGHRIHNQIAFPLSFTSTRNKDDFFCGQGPAPRWRKLPRNPLFYKNRFARHKNWHPRQLKRYIRL